MDETASRALEVFAVREAAGEVEPGHVPGLVLVRHHRVLVVALPQRCRLEVEDRAVWPPAQRADDAVLEPDRGRDSMQGAWEDGRVGSQCRRLERGRAAWSSSHARGSGGGRAKEEDRVDIANGMHAADEHCNKTGVREKRTPFIAHGWSHCA